MTAGTIELLAVEIGRVLEPLETRLRFGQVSGLLAELGLSTPGTVLDRPEVADALEQAADAAGDLPAHVGALLDAIASEDPGAVATVSARLIEAIRAVVAGIDSIADALRLTPPETGAPEAQLRLLAETLPRALIDFLVVSYVEARRPRAARTGALLGLIESTPVAASATTPAHRRRAVHGERLGLLFSDPEQLFEDVYGWGTDALDAETLLSRLTELLAVVVPPARFIPAGMPGGPALQTFLARIRPRTDRAPHALEISFAVTPAGERSPATPAGDLSLQLPLASDRWTAQLEVRGPLELGIGTPLEPPARLRPIAPTGPVAGRAALEVARITGERAPVLLVGESEGTRLAACEVRLTVGAAFEAGESLQASLVLDAQVEGGELVIDLGASDSFLGQFLPPSLTTSFDAGLAWSEANGLTVSGSTRLAAVLPFTVTLGPLRLDTIGLALVPTANDVAIEVGVAGRVSIGPVTAAFEDVGAAAVVSIGRGSLGPVDVAFPFRPPSGAGLSVDAAAVTGGGFLSFDAARGLYAGVVQLEFERLQLNAFGLVTTRLPDGREGFSMVLLVQASGFRPIQLGLGFTLNGVGGLLAINRVASVEALRAGLGSGVVDDVLFTEQDPVPRAAQIVGALDLLFPPAHGRHVFGPMVRIGWGVPTLLTFELALLLELPAPLRLVALGHVRALLPPVEESLALVRLNMDALGVIDFDRRQAAVDAVLYDSQVVGFELTGEMAMRASWGERPDFALSVGGFHPGFEPPPGFPTLRRLTLALASGDSPRARVECYLALTPNTVQLGGRLDLRVEALGFALEGGLGFDALVNLSPFGFQASLAARLALKRGGGTLMGIDVRVELSGPAPWRARGVASFELLFVKLSLPFDVSFGRPQPLEPPPAVELGPRLREALADARNWSGELPAAVGRIATLRPAPAAAGELPAHPLAELAVRQRLLPLERTVERFGAAAPVGERRFAIDSVVLGGRRLASPRRLTDLFAPAQFFALGDAQALSSPSFDRMPNGVAFAGGAPQAGPARAVVLGYETVVIGADGEPAPSPAPVPLAAERLLQLAQAGAAAEAATRHSGRAKFAGPERTIRAGERQFALAGRDALAPPQLVDEPDGSWSGAADALARRLAAHPDERGRLQIVERQEIPA